MRTITMGAQSGAARMPKTIGWLMSMYAPFAVGILARCKAYPSALKEMRKEQLMLVRCQDAHVRVSKRQRGKPIGVNAVHPPGVSASFFVYLHFSNLHDEAVAEA